MIDSITIELNYSFGAARKWGAIGYAIGVGFTGYIAGASGLTFVIPIFSLLLMSAGLIMIAFIKCRGKHSDHIALTEGTLCPGEIMKDRKGLTDLLRNKRYMALLVAAFFINGPSFAHNTYFSFLYRGQGGTLTGMGFTFLLMAACEAPFMA